MPDWIQQVFDAIELMDEPAQSAATTALVTTCVIYCVYYAVVGLVVWALGRRLIQASFAAWREARHDAGRGSVAEAEILD